ncbi:glycosyltransferase family 4 protein [Calothrix sp. 336/3]|uniref:glycosyltransferase family 4 protein n=1 Tax=Calothrix sp. 336/3 TaxID=1337936 RepID=UPI0004E41F94|nr:glycosyltransferase family 4 protein [Calothrix sp. 336/3]AKG23975.1 glycosyl transferase family 1 [Calothrix sp. 336/3]
MEKLANDTFSLWREEGCQSIQQNFEVFRNLLASAKDLAECGKYDAASVYAQVAAFHAQYNHCGFFVSPELEHILIKIGRSTIPPISPSRNKSTLFSGEPKKILHVSTNISSPFGGIPRLLRRWIQQDTERSHSVVLTGQIPLPVPKILRDTVINSHGKIYLLDMEKGGVVSTAKRLRQYAAMADIVVLHTWESDVIATIAFANKEQSPPVIYVNHSDHCFWLGACISDVIVNLRESGMHLSQERRGIEAERNLLLPTILEPLDRVLSQAEAKRQIGLAEDSLMLLSIARPAKYKTIDGITFADAHVPLLEQYEQAVLVVIGPGSREEWSAAIQKTQGRIRVLEQTENTAVFYQAADIYVDSYPFISNTSLLEAGSYGVPLVTRYPFPDACEILRADVPGLIDNIIQVRSLEEYTAVLSRLVEDEEFRLSLGEATKKKIAETHWGSNWQHFLENVYHRAATLPRSTVPSVPIDDKIFLSEPDVFLPRIHGQKFDFDYLIQESALKFMPLYQKLLQLMRLVKKYGIYKNSSSRLGLFGYLVPNWLRYSINCLRDR